MNLHERKCGRAGCWCTTWSNPRGVVIHLPSGAARAFELNQRFLGGVIDGIDRKADVLHLVSPRTARRWFGV